MPATNDTSMSFPSPLPLANLTKNPFVNVGPKNQTIPRLIKKIAIQLASKTIVKGITGNTNPLIHGIELINGLLTYMGWSHLSWLVIVAWMPKVAINSIAEIIKIIVAI